MEIWVRARRDPTVRDSYFRLDRRQRKLIADIVREGQESGEFNPDADADEFAIALSGPDGRPRRAGHARSAGRRADRMIERCLALASSELGAICEPPRDWRARCVCIHVRDGWAPGSGVALRPDGAAISRRQLLRRGAGLALGGLLAGCSSTNPAGNGQRARPLPRPGQAASNGRCTPTTSRSRPGSSPSGARPCSSTTGSRTSTRP